MWAELRLNCQVIAKIICKTLKFKQSLQFDVDLAKTLVPDARSCKMMIMISNELPKGRLTKTTVKETTITTSTDTCAHSLVIVIDLALLFRDNKHISYKEHCRKTYEDTVEVKTMAKVEFQVVMYRN